MLFLCIFCLLSLGFSLENNIIGVRNLYKSFPMNNKLLFSMDKSKSKYVLKNINIELGTVTTFIGPSKSGKSTLAKCIIGMENVDQGELILNLSTGNSTKLITDEVSCKLMKSCGYLDHLYSLSYDSDKTVGDIIAKYRSVNQLTESIINIINIPLNEKVNNLLESQKILFELMSVLMKITNDNSSNNSNSNNNNNNNNNYNNNNNDFNPIIVMDEYLDKVIPSVRSKFYKSLQLIIANIPMKVIIITHSKSVLQEITEKIVVIKVSPLH